MAPERVTGRTKAPEIRKGDTVVVLSGKDAGKRGVVDRLIRRDPSPRTVPSAYRRTSSRGGVFVVLANTNIAKRHTKPRQRSTSGARSPGCRRSSRAASSTSRSHLTSPRSCSSARSATGPRGSPTSTSTAALASASAVTVASSWR